jgi:putative tryptophan/tyrosine transport system substrate-binding protein
MMDRRVFIGSLGLGALAWPHPARAQPARGVPRIGVLSFAGTTAEITGPDPSRPSIKALLRGLRELGYVYGRDFVTEPRAGEGRPERWPVMVADLVRLQVDVIVAPGPNLPLLKRATTTIPIVMAAGPDPVGDGYVQSLGRPGGNFTGLSLQEIDTTGKRLELLKALVPSAAPVAVLWNNVHQNSARYWQAAEAAAGRRGWKLLKLEIRNAGELEGAFKTATRARAGALLTIASTLLFGRARQLAELAAANRLPAMYELRAYVEAGGLISYGADVDALWHRAASFVDKILKGAQPAELPVEQPSKFELLLNLKTAKALGLTVPPSLLARVDQVIE